MRIALAAACVAFCSLVSTAPSAAGEMEERRTIEEDAKEAFLAGRFDWLDATAGAYRTTKEATQSGWTKLGFFYETLSSPERLYDAADAPAIDKLDAQVSAWLNASPTSTSANILRAHVLLARAWLARGPGFAHTGSPEQWDETYKFAGEAARQLDANRSIAAVDPEWHAVFLEVGLLMSWSPHAFNAMAEEGLKVDPTYYPLHSKILRKTLPQWGGGWDAFDDAVDRLVARTSKDHGLSFYARAYNWVARTQLRRLLFQKSLAKWPRMKQGFEDLIQRYPSDWNLNAFGVSACFARDWETLKSIVDRLGGRFIDEAWAATAERERCVRALKRIRTEAEDAAYYSKPMPVSEEMNERLRIEQQATAALLEGRFDEIEAERARLLMSQERTASGDWKLPYYTEGLTPFRLLLPGSGDVGMKVRDQIAAWRLSRPDSIVATLAALQLHLHDRRLVRGLYPGPTEVGQGRAQEAKYLEMARRDLEASRARGERDPVWWTLKQAVSAADGVIDEAFVEDAFAALAVEPNYDVTRIGVLSRAQFGDGFSEAHRKMLAIVMQGLPQDRADEVYADAFLRLGDRMPSDQILQTVEVDWPRMQRGLDVITTRWPTNWNLTAYARFACILKDKPTASALMARLGDRLDESRWSNWRGHKECRSWAQAAQ